LPAQIWSGFMRTALKNTPATALPRAEPLEQPSIAEREDQGEGLFDRLGDFFGRLFGGNRNAPPRRPHGWMRSSDNSWHYVPEEDRQKFAAGEDQHEWDSNSQTPNRQFYAQAPRQRYAYHEQPHYSPPGDGEYQRAQPRYDLAPNDGYLADQRRYSSEMFDRRADMPYPYFSEAVP
jgi:hypothetical protein